MTDATGKIAPQRESPGRLAAAVAAEIDRLARAGAVRRLWSRDPSLWKAEAGAQHEIAERLGWLDGPAWLAAQAAEIGAFAREVRAGGAARVVLLGMGGSSLAPEVLEAVAGVRLGWPRFAVLDSTDPEAVAGIRDAAGAEPTFFLVASKSGGTIETLSHYRFFAERSRAAAFAAITDAGSPLERLARERGFRRIFLNPADIGGRYSALSYFGMVPAALMGHDLGEYAAAAAAMAAAARAESPAANPALRLGAFMGGAARAGADKLTLLSSPRLRPFGYWIEQLVAESTGKEGRGIVPVEGEPPGRARDYGDDRAFAVLRLGGAGAGSGAGAGEEARVAELAAELERAGHPLVEISLPHVPALAGEFLRWEIATAIAGSTLGINPFDQPNVQESKDRTAALLAEAAGPAGATEAAGGPRARAERTLRLPAGAAGIELHASGPTWARLGEPAALDAALAALLALARPGEYLALLTYVARTAARESALARLRAAVRDATRLPVLQGYGPRYLHSIGQLHKGGPPGGLFLVVTHAPGQAPGADPPIPGAAFGFAELEAAQARGDLEALEARGKPALRVHLTAGIDRGLEALAEALAGAAMHAGRR